MEYHNQAGWVIDFTLNSYWEGPGFLCLIRYRDFSWFFSCTPGEFRIIKQVG
jgi:hypothetical protein